MEVNLTKSSLFTFLFLTIALFILVDLCMDANRILNLSNQFKKRINTTQKMFGYISLEHIARSQYYYPSIKSVHNFTPLKVVNDRD